MMPRTGLATRSREADFRKEELKSSYGVQEVTMRNTFMIGITLLIAFHTQAQSFEQRHTHDIAENPPDVVFTLGTKDGQNTFHPGEAIPVVLEFSSSTRDKYRLDGATYDRSGRLRIEEFVLD